MSCTHPFQSNQQGRGDRLNESITVTDSRKAYVASGVASVASVLVVVASVVFLALLSVLSGVLSAMPLE